MTVVESTAAARTSGRIMIAWQNGSALRDLEWPTIADLRWKPKVTMMLGGLRIRELGVSRAELDSPLAHRESLARRRRTPPSRLDHFRYLAREPRGNDGAALPRALSHEVPACWSFARRT